MQLSDIKSREVGYTEFTDSHANTHKVKHSIIFTDCEKRELEDKIADELYRIFTSKTI